MPDYEVPEGYAPYRLFSYKDGNRAFSVRPDAFECAQVELRPEGWMLLITLRADKALLVRFDFDDEVVARKCHKQLVTFVEQDALRHVHNGLSKKARTNAG